MLTQIAYLLLGALGLGFLIFIHELAHYFMAIKVGMKVEAFSIGFGAAIFKWKRKDVEWRLGWIPFGGYVKIAGERKENNQNPRDVPGGFFNSKPLDRVKVAIIAPIVNLVFAFILFTVIWGMGGREKTFQDMTNRIGWVDPKSELYQANVRPGDEITLYNGRKFHGFKDIFQSTMMANGSVQVKGYQYNYEKGTRKPFDVEVSTYQHPDFIDKDIKTVGILSPANYLLYNKLVNDSSNVVGPGNLPMSNSGLTYGDRLIWMDGELLFSNAQLGALLNSQYTFLTVDRQGEILQLKVPTLLVSDLKIPGDYRSDLEDIRYESNLNTRLHQLKTIPYQISSNLEVEIPLRYLDSQEAYKTNAPFSRLLVGDKIIAIDGNSIQNLKELLTNLQTHKFNIIVQSGNQSLPLISWEKANATFDQNINWSDLNKLKSTIGLSGHSKEIGNLKLLKPIIPMSLLKISETTGNEQLANALIEQRQKIEEIQDPEKRQINLKMLKEKVNRLYLGVNFHDRLVNYNPPPYISFGRATGDIYHTLKSLISGNLSPKWLSGPIGIVQAMQYGWSLGVKEALYWLALISLNLGILNLLPIPVLDGGQVCFALYEQITRKELKAKTMDRIVIPFMILFIGFFVFVTFHDVFRIIKGIF